MALVSRLEQELPSGTQDPVPFLHGRIMSALGRTVAERRVSPGSWLLFPAGGTVIVVIALLFLTQRTGDTPLHPIARHDDPSSRQPDFARIPGGMRSTLDLADGGRLIEWGNALNQPLHAEMEHVRADARQAIDSLANNLLPRNLYAAVSQPRGSD